MEALAIDGGRPLRTLPFPNRKAYGEDDLKEVREALESRDLFYTADHKCVASEQEFAATYSVKHARTCSSGTAAVHMAVAALDADPGGEIITAPATAPDARTIA